MAHFNMQKRISRGSASRLSRGAKLSGLAALAMIASSPDAWADCRRSGTGGAVTALDLVPLATGTAISSMIATINAVNASSLAQSSAFVAAPTGSQTDVSGGGRWSRIIVGTDDVEATTKVSGTVGGIAQTDDSCRSTTRLEYIGTQAGVDIGRFKFNDGTNVQWGFTAGYVDVEAKDKTPNVGTFSSDNQVAFAGLYLALSKGNFSFDAQLRGDHYSMSLNDVDNALFDQPLTARGMAALANASYRFDLQNNWFVEPSIGGVFSHTDVNALDVSGAIDLPASVTPSITVPGTVQVGAITSALARASVRVGTTILTPTMAWQPFATFSVFHEFADDVRTSISTGPAPLSGGGPIAIDAVASTERLGTYGHVGLGLAGVVLNSGWLGYVRGDYRFGDNIEALSFNAGLRYQFEPAKHADGSVKDGGETARPYHWTGLYVGMNSGGSWGQQEWTYETSGNLTSPAFRGYLIGGQVGYDYQFGTAVVGIEADYNWTNAEGGESCPNKNSFSCIGEVGQVGFLTGRLGFTSDRVLYYAKAGLAFAEVTARTQFNLADQSIFTDTSAGTTKSVTGWAAGLGMEFAIDDRWSARGEVMHYDLGKDAFTVDNGLIVDVETTGTLARVGLNYRFGQRGHDAGYASMK